MYNSFLKLLYNCYTRGNMTKSKKIHQLIYFEIILFISLNFTTTSILFHLYNSLSKLLYMSNFIILHRIFRFIRIHIEIGVVSHV